MSKKVEKEEWYLQPEGNFGIILKLGDPRLKGNHSSNVVQIGPMVGERKRVGKQAGERDGLILRFSFVCMQICRNMKINLVCFNLAN